MPTEPAPPGDGAPVTVVGNLCWDVLVRGLASAPAWGKEVEGTDSLQAPGGQGYNLAVAMRSLGVGVRLVGAVGDDAAGSRIVACARQFGVDTAGVTAHAALPTAVTMALVRTDGERAFASDFGCQRRYGLAEIIAAGEAVTAAPCLCLAGLFNLPGLAIEDAAELLARARAAGTTTVLDTGWDPLGWPEPRARATRALLRHVDVFLPNRDEATALTGCADPGEAAAALRADGPSTVVVKCGGEGSVGVDERRRVRAAALTVTVRDAVGAGDTFDAGFIAGTLAGGDLQAGMTLATAAAGLRISGDAASWPTRSAAAAATGRVAVDSEPVAPAR